MSYISDNTGSIGCDLIVVQSSYSNQCALGVVICLAASTIHIPPANSNWLTMEAIPREQFFVHEALLNTLLASTQLAAIPSIEKSVSVSLALVLTFDQQRCKRYVARMCTTKPHAAALLSLTFVTVAPKVLPGESSSGASAMPDDSKVPARRPERVLMCSYFSFSLEVSNSNDQPCKIGSTGQCQHLPLHFLTIRYLPCCKRGFFHNQSSDISVCAASPV